MDDEFRTEKRAAWQDRTPLAKRWLLAGIIFVVVLLVLLALAAL